MHASFLHGSLSALVSLTLLATRATAQTFALADSFVGDQFFAGFNWETLDDPTHGRVNYVDKGTAQQTGLAEARGDKFFLRADSTNVVPQGARGRDSNRLSSYNSYTDSVIILDVEHMPVGCATWPAFWTVTAGQWPDGGEIDIIEGVNTNTQNLVSLHTSPDCTMSQQRDQTGASASTDCNAYANGNQGCGVAITDPNSYGTGLNDAGGGWYAIKRTQNDGVYAYFWSRGDPSVPREVRERRQEVNPDNWGTPDARFPSSDTCNFASHFDAHQITFDLTFCGDWAGNAYGSSGCGADMNACIDFVDNNPGAFAEAYWEINSLRVYAPSGQASPPPPPPPSDGQPDQSGLGGILPGLGVSLP